MIDLFYGGFGLGLVCGIAATVLVLYLPMRSERRASADNHRAIAQLQRQPYHPKHRPQGTKPRQPTRLPVPGWVSMLERHGGLTT